MAVEITIPSPGESVTEVTLGPWLKGDGEWVDRDEPVIEIESDKATLEIPAPESGVLHHAAAEGDELKVGEVVGTVDPDAERPAGGEAKAEAKAEAAGGEAPPERAAATAAPPAEPKAPAAAGAEAAGPNGVRATSVAKKIADERGLNLRGVMGTGPGGRVTKADVLAAAEAPARAPEPKPGDGKSPGRGARRERMTKLRQRIAQRLVSAQQTAAMLTTFNEADMSEVMRLRKAHKEAFAERHGVGLGFMSFFVKAAVSALQAFPRVNAYIIGDEIEYHDYIDISVAVGTERGLVVPVLRNAESLSFAQIEATIRDFATRAKEGSLTIDEMTGGTFTISNGGVYGSVNSTPILNPPQSAILGMHAIRNRPVEDPDHPGQIALRPMMNLAVSYDHRIIDGAEAVSFLVHLRNAIEKPERLLLGM